MFRMSHVQALTFNWLVLLWVGGYLLYNPVHFVCNIVLHFSISFWNNRVSYLFSRSYDNFGQNRIFMSGIYSLVIFLAPLCHQLLFWWYNFCIHILRHLVLVIPLIIFWMVIVLCPNAVIVLASRLNCVERPGFVKSMMLSLWDNWSCQFLPWQWKSVPGDGYLPTGILMHRSATFKTMIVQAEDNYEGNVLFDIPYFSLSLLQGL